MGVQPSPLANALMTRTATNTTGRKNRWDFVAMGLGAILLAGLSFVPGVVESGRRLGPVTPLVAIHGALAGGWLLLFLAQALCIATRRVGLHKRLGVASIGLAVALVVVGYRTAIALAVRGYDLSGDLNVRADPLAFLVFPLGDLVSFVALFAAALIYRRRPAAHKRLMFLATIGMMTPSALAHLAGHNFRTMPLLFLPMLAVVFASPAIYDRIRLGRWNRLTVWAAILLFAWGNVRALLIGSSMFWKNIAAWLVS